MICPDCGGNKGFCECIVPIVADGYVRMKHAENPMDGYTTELWLKIKMGKAVNRFRVHDITSKKTLRLKGEDVGEHFNVAYFAHNFEGIR